MKLYACSIREIIGMLAESKVIIVCKMTITSLIQNFNKDFEKSSKDFWKSNKDFGNSTKDFEKTNIGIPQLQYWFFVQKRRPALG